MGDRASAELWDKECGQCRYRNGFIVPSLQGFIARRALRSVLDVGAATGYIARKVATSSEAWTLLDEDEQRLELAKERCEGTFSYVVGNVFEQPAQSFDLILLSNTLLEFDLSNDRAGALANLVKPEGWLAVFLPDTLTDVISEFRKGNDVFDDYRKGNLRLEKQDKFTKTPYPFVAHRPIDIVCAFLKHGLRLVEAERSDEGALFLAFQAGGEDT